MPATVWKGYLSFGLVSFPIRLFAAARPEPVRFHLLHKKDLSRVKEVMYCAAENKPLDRSEIVKGYEYEKNEYVAIEPGDLEKIAPPTATTMEILQFVHIEEIDPIFLQTSYYVAPEEAVSRPYALLLEAMRETKYDAVAKVAMHGREHIVVLRPTGHGIVLHTIFFASELHKSNEINPAPAKFERKEIDLAKKLIESLAAPFRPEQYHDEYKRRVEELIDKKRKGQKITPAKQQPRRAPVIDIMTALQQSLSKTKAASKHAVSSTTPRRPARKRAAKTA